MAQNRQAGAPKRRAVFQSLRFQVIAIMLLCYAIPALLLGIFTQTVLLTRIREKTEAALTTGVEHAWTLTTRNIERAIELSRGAVYDGELADAYDRWNGGEITDAEYLRLSRGYIERKYSRESLFTFAACFPLNRPELYMYTRSGSDPALAFQAGGQADTVAMSDMIDTGSRFIRKDGQLWLVRNLVNLRMERYGMLVLGIGEDALFAPLLDLAETWEGSIRLRLDGSGDADTDWDSLAAGISENGQELWVVKQSTDEEYALDMLLSLNKRSHYREIYEFRYLALAIYLLLVPILGLLAWYVGKRIIKPITLLSKASRQIENGELGVTVPMKGKDELGDLGRAFSRMSRRIEELIDKTYKEELALKDAQIQALQSRINPHFINNALEAINWEARMEKSETITAMIGALSVLLNASMSRRDKRLVTVKEEIGVAEAYIYFVQQRFGDSLTVRRETDEAAAECQVPLLTVQPVLENAVEHGIAPAGGGMIRLSCRKEGEFVRIEIMNTGQGITPDDREKIDAALRGETGSGTHLGLANIADRLRLIYGGRAEIRVFSDEEDRTVVQIDIPTTIPT